MLGFFAPMLITLTDEFLCDTYNARTGPALFGCFRRGSLLTPSQDGPRPYLTLTKQQEWREMHRVTDTRKKATLESATDLQNDCERRTSNVLRCVPIPQTRES